MQKPKKYRIKEFLDQYREQHGSVEAQRLEVRILLLTMSSKSKFYYRYTATLGETDKAKTISVSDMMMVMNCLNEKRPEGHKIKLQDLYHPETQEVELSIYMPIPA